MNVLFRLTVSIVLLPPMSITVTAAAVIFLMSAGFGAHVPPTLGSVPVAGTQLPPFVPHCAFIVQLVLQVPVTALQAPAVPPQSASVLHAVPVAVPPHVLSVMLHEPAAPPGQVESAVQAAAAGPLKSVKGGLGEAQIELT